MAEFIRTTYRKGCGFSGKIIGICAGITSTHCAWVFVWNTGMHFTLILYVLTSKTQDPGKTTDSKSILQDVIFSDIFLNEECAFPF